MESEMITLGSEWTEWDLHFHTPSSYDYGDKSITNHEIIEYMHKNGISVFAITDHHIIDVNRYKELTEIAKDYNITVLPGIEFLSDSRGKDPIHFIGIFSETSDIDYIWGQLKNKSELHRIDLEMLKFNEVYCPIIQTAKLVRELGGITTIHAGGKSGTIENITNSLPHNIAQKKDIFKVIDIFELGKEEDRDGYINHVFPALGKKAPLIICSDNHNVKKYSRKQKLWIKGKPNFSGLKYALNEPDERFYIGAEPAVISRTKNNKTKYINKLIINRIGNYDKDNIWFENIEIPLNNELISIIGHKGNGKSAISDIIALCADAEHSLDYIFLNKNKFQKKGLADRFQAQVEFASGKRTELKTLFEQVDDTQERLVRYLPQSYFEKVCNEIGKVESFRKEIEKVVFQYIPIHSKLNKENFEDLIEFKKDIVSHDINRLRNKIEEKNSEIISLENILDPTNIKNLASKEKIKRDEIASHNTLKPSDVPNPALNGNADHTQKNEALVSLKDEKEKIDKEIKELNSISSDSSIVIEELSGLMNSLKSKIKELEEIIHDGSEITNKVDININDIIKFNFNESLLEDKINEKRLTIIEITKTMTLDEDYKIKPYEDLNIESKRAKKQFEIDEITSSLGDEQKNYEKYLRESKEWQDKLNELYGDSEKPDSLNHILEKQKYINNEAKSKLSKLRNERIELTLEIYDKMTEVKNIYDEIKTEIDTKLTYSNFSGLTIASAFHVPHDLSQLILKNVRQNRIGSFYGTDDGNKILTQELLSITNWDERASIKTFLENVIDYLENDRRTPGSNQETYIGDIVKNREDIYKLLFSLEYINPHYDLRHNGKNLEQLSPGEKGALLLVFYLVLDKEDIPLIIDQPEDNLDNNSVATLLVPFIKEAKKKRQIIIVTHNPNLAVVSDSEQIIKVKLDKENGNTFSLEAGGIEDEIIKDSIIDVLEGTIPAFSLRKNKYSI